MAQLHEPKWIGSRFLSQKHGGMQVEVQANRSAGALRAGWAAAFVARPGMVPDPLFGQPDIVGADLAVVAEGILAGDGPGKPISQS